MTNFYTYEGDGVQVGRVIDHTRNEHILQPSVKSIGVAVLPGLESPPDENLCIPMADCRAASSRSAVDGFGFFPGV